MAFIIIVLTTLISGLTDDLFRKEAKNNKRQFYCL